MNITVFSTATYEKPYLKAEEQDDLKFRYHKRNLSEATASLAKGSEAVVLFTNDKADAKALEALKDQGVKFIATRTMGVDHIDTDKASELGLKVANVPHYSPHSVAEHSVTLMLALNRKLVLANSKVRNYDFRLKGLVGFDMNKKTVGILGAGEIGAVSARILHGLGCRILIYDIKENEELKKNYDARYVGLEELCQSSDIISIHAPLTEETRHLVSRETIDQMKEGVMIINTARGPICKTEDLIEGLKSGKIGYLGLDVYEYEAGLFFEDHTTDIIQDDLLVHLLGFKNVIITAHQSFLTHEALKEDMQSTLDNLRAWARGDTPENELE